VLEAMAMAKPVVVTAASAAALSVRHGVELEVASEPLEFAAKVLGLMDSALAERMGGRARSRILNSYGWPESLNQLDELLEQGSPTLRAGVATLNSGVHYALRAK
jgi:glycosyltransferase involved in cell wall biosynthesis